MGKYIKKSFLIQLCDWYEREFPEAEYVLKPFCDELCNLPEASSQELLNDLWIPVSVSESLPAQEEEVIILCCEYPSCGSSDSEPLYYTTTGYRWADGWLTNSDKVCHVIAWMPKPAVTKGVIKC